MSRRRRSRTAEPSSIPLVGYTGTRERHLRLQFFFEGCGSHHTAIGCFTGTTIWRESSWTKPIVCPSGGTSSERITRSVARSWLLLLQYLGCNSHLSLAVETARPPRQLSRSAVDCPHSHSNAAGEARHPQPPALELGLPRVPHELQQAQPHVRASPPFRFFFLLVTRGSCTQTNLAMRCAERTRARWRT